MSDIAETLDDIQTEMGDCQRCPLCKNRENLTFGEGKSDADIMFVGGTPGPEGTALVGKLLTKLKMRSADVYFTSVVKCDGRNPKRDEVKACAGFLTRQINAVKPRVLVALGKQGANHLAKQFNLAMSSLREEEWTYESETHRAWMVPTYHPKWLLAKHGEDKRPALMSVLRDLQKAVKLVSEEIPPKAIEEGLNIDFSAAYVAEEVATA